MVVSTCLISILFLFFFFTPPNKDRTEAYMMICLLFGSFIVGASFYIHTQKPPIHLLNQNILFLTIFSIGLIFANRKLMIRKKNILASQARFWNIHPKEMLDNNKRFFKWKPPFVKKIQESNYEEVTHPITRKTSWKFVKSEKVIKVPARKEAIDLPEPYLFEMDQFGQEKILGKLIYSDIARFNRFTILGSLQYFESDICTRLHRLIYNKLIELSVLNEKHIDFEKALEKNKFILQFFILDLWEQLAKDDIIGVSSLYAIINIYPETEIEKKELDLVGAMDSLINTNIVPYGIDLLSHYYNFKGMLLDGRD